MKVSARFLACAICTLGVLRLEAQGPQGAASAGTAVTNAERQAMVTKYCVTCHSDRLKTAGLVLENLDLSRVPSDAHVWEKVARKLRAGAMPPQGMPRPEPGALNEFAAYLETTLDRAAMANPNPGRTIVHRLNRTEYANAIKDVLGLDVNAGDLLPPDDSADGFDNIAQTLTLSPVLMERYLSASAKVASQAVGDPAIRPVVTTYRPKPDLSQDKHIPGLPLGTVGGILVTHNFPLDGEYLFEPKISRSILGNPVGVEDVHALEVTLDGARVKLAHFGGPEDDAKSHLTAVEASDEIDARFVFRMRVPAGPHKIGVAFLRHSTAQTAEVWQQFQRTAIDSNETKGAPHLDKINITGPFDASGPGNTPSRQKIFICRPEAGKDEVPCARKILTSLARRAYRRPVNDNDIEQLLVFYQRGRNNRGTFDQGIEMAIRRLISGPEFVFRVETDPANIAPNTAYRVSDLELAARLSFFLWSTIPDDQLFETAVQGKLKDPAVLDAQVRRMLAGAKAESMVKNFAGQWLTLRNLRGVVPDPDIFPDYDDNLRQALERETELLFESIMKEDRSVLDLLTADYTFLNERLARHYGVPGIYGDRFRRVKITQDARRGLLGQGSILTLTSVAIRTSPVARGKWILTNLVGTPPPPPPPNVPALKENKGGRTLSMRERMTAHRGNPVCANCHRIMDPIGFSLENFDAVGRWREKDGDADIDAKDTLFDGSTVDGAVGLRNFLLSRKEVFVQTFTERMLTYALGRGLEYYDMPTVRKIVRDAAKNDYKFSAMVMGVVKSIPFQMRMKPAQSNETAAVTPAGPVAERPSMVAASVRP
jgi:mono/diheme cytochrome c family protein